MNKARILFLTTSYPSHEDDPSSVFLSRLAVSLCNIGYSVSVLAPSDGTFFGRREVSGIPTIRFAYFWPKSMHVLTTGSGGVPENLARGRVAWLQLIPMMFVFLLRTLFQLRTADLIYANWLGAGIVGAAASRLTRKPMVISFRGDDGYLARDRVLWRFLTRWVSARARVVAPVSEEIAGILVDLGINREKIRLPRFGVDTDMFHPAKDRERYTGEARVLFVGSLIPRKGLQDLLEALAHPDLGTVRLTVVGDGFLRDQLQEKCNQLGVQDRVDWKGLQKPQEVASIMSKSDILCIPSYMEGTPNVIKEAMATALPVIATRVGGIPELVVEGETGLLYDPGNIEKLRECLRSLGLDKHLRKQMGRAGYLSLSKASLSWETTAEDFHQIFSDVIDAGASGRKKAPEDRRRADA